MAMNPFRNKLIGALAAIGPRFLPFADAATVELPLRRLLRLALFQVSVGMSLVLLIGTLNRVMIVELGVAASLVSAMLALPLLAAPFRAIIGFKSDNHQSALGWRRVPFIWMGTLLQFGGFAIMPFALLVLSGAGQSGEAPTWIGHAAAALAFLLVGSGVHTTQTVGLALATDLAPTESQPKVVGLMYAMLLIGMILSAFIFGTLLEEYSPGRLIQVIQGAAAATLILNITALWKQEARSDQYRIGQPREQTSFASAWSMFLEGKDATRRLLVVGMGTMAFTMEDVLLEPYGGEILGMSVALTTTLTATLAIGGLAGFAWASKVLGRGADPFRMAGNGALLGIPAFIAVMTAAPMQSVELFALGTFLIGAGGGMFGHGTLTATMNLAAPGQAGLALGAWGAVQATMAGIAMGLGGVIRDVVAAQTSSIAGYLTVYTLEILLLQATLMAMRPLLRRY
jgi:BCD family chlorophyll transporter-like MFS transporter